MEKNMKRAERRKLDFKKAIRKMKLAEAIYCDNYINYFDFGNTHQYSKNKIHFSCGVCCNKTNNKTKRNVYGNYRPSFNPSASDRRKLDKLFYEENDIDDK